MTAPHCLGVDRHRSVEHRRRAAQPPRESANDRHVLLPDRHFHAGPVVAILHHHGCSQFEHARIGGTRSDHVEHDLRVEAGLEPEHHRLGAGDVVDGDQKVGDIFHAAAVAKRAEVVHRAREPGKQRAKPADRLAIATRIDHQILHFGLGAGAAHRAVEHDVASLAQRAFGLELVVDGEGAGFDDDPRADSGVDDRLHRRIERGWLGEAGDDGADLAGECFRIGCDLDAGSRHGAAARCIDVVAHHPPAGGKEVTRERAAHDPEADDTDFAFRHCQPPLPIDRAADATRRALPRSSSIWPRGAAPGLCLSRARIIPYGRRPLPERCGGVGESPQGEGEHIPMQIGIAGIGKMGAAIAHRLIEVGHKVTVWNRSADKLQPVMAAGAVAAATPAELARNAEAVITILTDAAAIDAVYTGASGLLAPDERGKLFIEMSTVQPQTEVALAAKVRAKGAILVECPVGGSTGPARQGKLIGLMGAEPADAARARPVLEQLCRRLEHCGPVGSGAVMKLTINMPLMIYWQALGEALALCRPLRLDPARIMDLLADTSGGPNVLKVRGAGVAQMLKGGDGGPVTFDVDSAVKDLRTMLVEGKARGVELPLVEKTLACYEETKRNVSGAAEVSAVSVYWANRAKK